MSEAELRELLDRQQILDRIADLGLGLDLSEPARYRRCFADKVEVRNPTFATDGGAKHYTGEEWVRSVAATQAALAIRLHALTCASVELAGDEAEAVVMQHAYFADRHGAYRVAGPLRLGFIRTGGGWRIRRLHFEVTWTEGDPQVYARAREAAR